jgi:hypothetical protein
MATISICRNFQMGIRYIKDGAELTLGVGCGPTNCTGILASLPQQVQLDLHDPFPNPANDKEAQVSTYHSLGFLDI